VEGGVLPGFPPTCWITGGANNEFVSVYLRACNDTGGTLYGVTPTRLTITTTETAEAEFLTLPGWRRSLVDGNCVNFKTQLRITGCGTVDIHGDITAEDEDGVTFTTGVAYCGSLVSNPIECLELPPTPTRTPVTVPTPRPRLPTPTLRPTRTRLPTATPRPRLATPTPRPAKEIATLRPTRTRIPTATQRPRLPTPTPKPAKEIATLRPTRTPIPTATPRPRLSTPTLRPTRTPLPTRTEGPFLVDMFTGRCIAINPHSSRVTVYLQLFNNTGADVYDIVPDELEVQTYGTVKIESLIGPVPRVIRVLFDRHSSRFQWTLEASGEGQIIIHASATGVGPADRQIAFGGGGGGQGIEVTTGRQECNVLNIPAR